MAYVLVTEGALAEGWTTPWIRSARPPHDLGATLCAAMAFALRQPGEEVLHLLRFPAPPGAPAPRGARSCISTRISSASPRQTAAIQDTSAALVTAFRVHAQRSRAARPAQPPVAPTSGQEGADLHV